MARENVVRLIILTACIFAFSIYMQKGTWVFPFPLYESAMVFAVVALLIADKKRPTFLGAMALIWSLLQLAVSDFILEFVINENTIDWFLNSLYLDLLHLTSWLFFFFWGIASVIQFRTLSTKIAGITLLTTFVVLVVQNLFFPAIFPLVLWLILFFTDRKEATLERQIAFLFTFFFSSKYLTIFFMVS